MECGEVKVAVDYPARLARAHALVLTKLRTRLPVASTSKFTVGQRAVLQ